MCGIVGLRGRASTLKTLISSLEKLEYRGYDSSGVCYIEKGHIHLEKECGKIQNLKQKLELNTPISLGIAHTRWATHGKANKQNAHPQKCGKIILVHNGIIENEKSLKEELKEKKMVFHSDTDTEVIAVLLNQLYEKQKDMNRAISLLLKKLEGSYALGIICTDEKETLYAVKKDSPLIIAKSSIGNFIASDVPAILEYSNQYYTLEDYEFAKIDENITIFNKNGIPVAKSLKKYDVENQISTKENYEHYMLKEIEEQPIIIDQLMSYYLSEENNIKKMIPDFKKYKKIEIVACGSAYHAGLVWKNLLENELEIETTVHLASEFRYQKQFLGIEVLTIFISQSGETADTREALKIAKSFGSITLAVVNVYESSLARIADYVVYTKAGNEIAVATTKGYTSQIMIASLIIASLKNLSIDKSFFEKMKKLLEDNLYLEIAKNIYQEEHLFFIGRGIDYALAMEGALKLKEISYIHAESYAAGELKHGTISLIEENSFVIGIITEESLKEKTISNLKEVAARGAKIILIIREDLIENIDFATFIIKIPKTLNIYQTILTILPLQKIAYETAKLRGCDIDQPKNLAKSVTVE